ncbi:MAG: outer membrane beta-barrel protein, partial [Sedimentisphaerales bacterium]|nr:outer membrane beta-barrel protein [Sedimentisphaerales bacterium]
MNIKQMQAGVVVFMLVGMAAGAFGQMGTLGVESSEWQVGLFGGWYTGGELQTKTYSVVGEVKAESDSGYIAGIRFGQDGEYLGWEATAAMAGADLNIEFDQLTATQAEIDAYDLDSDSFSMLLVNVNAMFYPAGNDIAEGRVRPFVTVGPGFASVFSDYGAIDGETVFDANVGLGVKFLLGDDGRTVLRFDYRWYYLVGSTADLRNSIYR